MRWFKHMTHSRRDEKLSALISELGMEGYGFYWMLLEVVAESLPKDATIAQVTYTLPQWSHLLYSHHHRVGNYLGKLGVTGLVTVEYVEGKIRVTIPNLLKYRDEYSRKSGHAPDKLPAKNTDTDTEADTDKEKPSLISLSVAVKQPHKVAIPGGFKSARHKQCFEEFWDAYPKKRMKAEAAREFARHIVTEKTFTEAMDGLRRGAGLGSEMQFHPDPNRWIKNSRWQDAVVPPAKKNGIDWERWVETGETQ